MTFRITVDLAACQGYANCLMEASALFDIDEDTNKAVLLGSGEHDEAHRERAEAARRGCPAHAIFLEDR